MVRHVSTQVEGLIVTLLRVTYRHIFGVGMMLIGVVAIWKPAGSITIADDFLGFSPLFHGMWYILSGWLLSRHRRASSLAMLVYTMPLLFYIFLTMWWIYLYWERSNLIILIQYIMLYLAILKLLLNKDA